MRVRRNQIAIYWPPAVLNSYSELGYGEAVEIAVRWVKRGVIYTTAEGKEARSESVVFPEQELLFEGLLLLGRLTDLTESQLTNPKSIPGVREIKLSEAIPGVRTGVLYRVIL